MTTLPIRFILWLAVEFTLMGLAVFASDHRPAISLACMVGLGAWTWASVRICPEIAID